jgi:hypothetical protein
MRDLVAGSGIRFQDRGLLPAAGLPDSWPLFRVERGVGI